MYKLFLEAQLLCNLIDVLTSLTHDISPLFVDRFGRFCHLEYGKEAISVGCRSENAWYRWRF